MPTYLIVNRQPEGYRGSPQAMAAWTAWFEQLGDRLVDPGNPVFARRSLGVADGQGVLHGYTLVDADDLDAAVDLAEGCPALPEGGGVEIGELTPLNTPGDDYQQTLTVDVPPDRVFEALTTTAGLAAWWAPVTGDGTEGGELRFMLGSGGPTVIRVRSAQPGGHVVWEVRDCPPAADWVGTSPTFTLAAADDGGCTVAFRHRGLTPRLECWEMCRAGWSHYLSSLRAYLETGTGDPRDPVRGRRSSP